MRSIERTTKSFYLFHFKGFRVPFTPMRMPKRMMVPIIKAANELHIKPLLTQDAIVGRALAYCDWAVAKGLLAIRSHVDTSDPSLLPVRAMLEVKNRVAPYLDLQLVAFPQDGVLRTPGGLDNLQRALDLGVDVVGGIPHFERTMGEGAASVKLLCELAAERGLPVDMH